VSFSPSARTAAKIFSRSVAEIGGSVLTGLIFAAGVTATGIRGALGTSADAAKAASASEPRGVAVFTVTELLLVLAGVDGLTG
ncbi:hypothetical protein, partial [Klebsiella pneumoniae]|uniref:hypothetical protein n=1 Tax=Klebsiella pneumoniae TaxID=573 RepID=UPI001C6F9E5F